MPLRLEAMLPVELLSHLAVSPVLVLPLGTIEWHSHHLPVGLDSIVAQGIGERMAEASNAVLAPTAYWAVGGVPFPFTLNLSLEVVEPLLQAVLQQFAEMGFRQIVLFTGHFGLDQTLATKRAALRAMQRTGTTVLPLTTYDLVADFYSGDHAGIGETSLMMALQPDLVRLAAWPAEEPLPGVIGEDPRPSANTKLGEKILGQSASLSAQLVSAFRDGRLNRDEWIAVLESVVCILEATRSMRQSMPRDRVPSLTTEDYLEGCVAITHCNLQEAQKAFRRKLASLKCAQDVGA